MSGLLKNELFTMRKVSGLYFIILMIYYALGVFGKGSFGVQIFAVFFSTMLVISSFSYEEKSGWDNCVGIFPVSGREIVLSKYLIALIYMGAAAGLGILVRTAANLKSGAVIAEGFWISAAAASVGCIFLAIIIPVLVKFGSEKGRVFLIALFLLPYLVFFTVTRVAGHPFPFAEWDVKDLLPFLAAASAVLMAVSYLVSVSIYKRKEF